MVASIRLEGDSSVAHGHVRAAKALLGRVVERREGLGVQTLSGAYAIDSNTYVYVLSTGTINIAQIVSRPAAIAAPRTMALDGTDMPLIGGVVFNSGQIKEGVEPNSGKRMKMLSTFFPTERTQRDLALKAEKQLFPRLAVDPFHEDLKTKPPSFINPESAFVYSQYTMLKPTMFTGAMKFAAQAVMSYGKQKIKISTKDASPSYVARVASNGFQILYDYHFSCTQGVVFGSDNEPWLVEISITNGIIITPLPRFSYTKRGKDRFGFPIWPYYDRCVKEERFEILAMLDLFGGLPTGEAFPADIPAAIKAGTVLQLAKPDEGALKDWFKCAGYSSALGWAFPDPRNTQAGVTQVHNTGYYWDEEESGVAVGVHYRVALTIGPYEPDNLKEKFELQRKPIAVASASVTKENWGYLIQGQPAPLFIKFWEPLLNSPLGGLLSVDVYPPPGKGRAFDADCETPMHVFYIGNDLKVVKFYHSAVYKYWGTVIPSGPECPYGWSGRTFERHIGTTRVDNQFISNDWDKREQVSDEKQYIDLVSSDLGYNTPYYTDRMDLPDHCYVYRQKIFLQTQTSVRESGEAHRSVVMVPAFMREAYYIGHERLLPVKVTTVSREYVAITDPWYGVGFRQLFASDMGPSAGCAKGSKTRIVIKPAEFTPYTGCTEAADGGGTWLSNCQDVENYVGGPYSRPTETDPEVEEVVREVQAAFYSCSQAPERSLDVTWQSFENQWMARSPDPLTTLTQFILATENTFGADSSYYAPDLAAAVRYEPALLANVENDGNITFVGVVS